MEEEIKKQIDEDMENESEEEEDQIADLGEVKDGMGKMNIAQNASVPTEVVAGLDDFVPKQHNFKSAGPPKAPGAQAKDGKYDPSSWDEYFDSKEMVDNKIPFYYAGTQGHVFLCLHGAGHSALSFASLAKILK